MKRPYSFYKLFLCVAMAPGVWRLKVQSSSFHCGILVVTAEHGAIRRRKISFYFSSKKASGNFSLIIAFSVDNNEYKVLVGFKIAINDNSFLQNCQLCFVAPQN